MPIKHPYLLRKWRNYLWITNYSLTSYKTCLKTIIFKIRNEKKELWKTVRLTSSQSPQIQYNVPHLSLSIRGSFSVYCVTYPFFSCFEQLYLCFTQFGSSTHCLNFVKFHDSSFKKVQSQKRNFFLAMKEYITARQLESHCRAVFQDCRSPDMIHFQRWGQH